MLKNLGTPPSKDIRINLVIENNIIDSITVEELFLVYTTYSINFPNSQSSARIARMFSPMGEEVAFGGEALFDKIEWVYSRNFKEVPIMITVDQQYIDRLNNNRAFIIDVLSNVYYAKLAKKFAELGKDGFVRNVVEAMIGVSLANAAKSGEWYKTNLQVGDKLVYINGLEGHFRNGEVVDYNTYMPFMKVYSNANQKTKRMVEEFTKTNSTNGSSSGGYSQNNSQNNSNGGAVNVQCKTVYTNSGAGDVAQQVCWPESA